MNRRADLQGTQAAARCAKGDAMKNEKKSEIAFCLSCIFWVLAMFVSLITNNTLYAVFIIGSMFSGIFITNHLFKYGKRKKL